MNILHFNTLIDQVIRSQPENSVLRRHFALLICALSAEQNHLRREGNQSRKTHIRDVVRVQNNETAIAQLLQERNLGNGAGNERVGLDRTQFVSLEKTLLI